MRCGIYRRLKQSIDSVKIEITVKSRCRIGFGYFPVSEQSTHIQPVHVVFSEIDMVENDARHAVNAVFILFAREFYREILIARYIFIAVNYGGVKNDFKRFIAEGYSVDIFFVYIESVQTACGSYACIAQKFIEQAF